MWRFESNCWNDFQEIVRPRPHGVLRQSLAVGQACQSLCGLDPSRVAKICCGNDPPSFPCRFVSGVEEYFQSRVKTMPVLVKVPGREGRG